MNYVLQICFSIFRMIIFYDQKIFSLNFIITSGSLPLYVLTKIFVEHLFLEYLFVPFDLFCKKGIFRQFANFTKKQLR